MEGKVNFEDLNVEYGESVNNPGSLFLYNDEENEFRLKMRQWAKENILPVDAEIERVGNVDLNTAFNMCVDIYKKMAKDGLLSLAFPTSIGGGGKGFVYRVISGEELAAINSAVVVTYGASANLFCAPIIHFGTEEQKKKYLIPVGIKGEKLGAIAITEPTAGSDAVGGMRTTAIKKGDKYIINGEKRFITNGSKADYLLLYALTNPDAPRKHQGISAFIFPTDTPGFEAVRDYELCGRKGSINSHLIFNNCEVSEENLVGGPDMENKGIRIMMSGLDGERCFTCSQYLGIARSAFEVAFKYANKRRQFDKFLREFEGISFRISNMYAKLEAGRLMMLRAARMLDAGLRATKEVAAAKFMCADYQMEICLDAVQICGGVGYTKDFPVERYFRDAKIGQISAGTTDILRFLCQRELYREIKE
ncbi:MAG: acyl-CoA dehydrogenase family protein [Candidatus Hodarchaeota archaeon]